MISVAAPLESVPMFVRGGAIIPMWAAMNYVGEKPADPITFNIYPDSSGSAATTLYEDDGLSPSYKQGVFRRTTVTARRNARGYFLTFDKPEGQYNPGPRKLVFSIITPGKNPELVSSTDTGIGQAIQTKANVRPH